MGHLDVGHHADSSSTARRHSELRPGTSVHLRRQPAEGKQFRQEDSLPRRSALKPTAQPVQATQASGTIAKSNRPRATASLRLWTRTPGSVAGRSQSGARKSDAPTRARAMVRDRGGGRRQLQAAEGGQPGAPGTGRVGQVGRAVSGCRRQRRRSRSVAASDRLGGGAVGLQQARAERPGAADILGGQRAPGGRGGA